MGANVADPAAPRLAAAYTAGAVAAAIFAVLGGLALAVLFTNARIASALDGLADHPWWMVYRGPAGDAATAWAVGSATAAALWAAGCLLAARRLAARAPALPALAAGLFLLTIAFECLRGGVALLVADDRSIAAALFLSRAVCWARFTGLLALLLVALHALGLPEQRPVVLVPVALVAALAMAASVPIDRTTFLAQLVFRLGDEQGVWFMNLVIGILIPLSIVAGKLVRLEARLGRLAVASVLLLAARELLFFGLHPVRLGLGLAVLAAGSVTLLDAIRRGYVVARETRGRASAGDSSAR
jgi:hypothetical protein